MSSELKWLTWTTLLTAVIWIPYILNRLREMGVVRAVSDSDADITPKALWAQRMMKAHRNAVENLVIFAPLVLVLHATGTATELTAKAAAVFFFARLAHVIVYTAGVPVIRTIAFAVGFACQIIIGLTALGYIQG